MQEHVGQYSVTPAGYTQGLKDPRESEKGIKVDAGGRGPAGQPSGKERKNPACRYYKRHVKKKKKKGLSWQH